MNFQKDEEGPPFFNFESVGNTLFTRARNIENVIGFNRIHIKFEGVNPTGTQKDRISIYHINKSLKGEYDGVTVGTCGNYGVSLAHFAKLAGLKTKILIPEKYFITPKRKIELNSLGAEIITVDGKYEDAVEESRKVAKEENLYDANPGNESEGWRGYMPIAYEIFNQLGRVPTAVSVPVGNGTTLLGIYHGFKDLLDHGLTDGMPYLVGASTNGGNPIVNSFKNSDSKVVDLRPDELNETSVNEPLISYHSYDGDEALKAIYDTNGWADYASDSRMLQLHTLLKDFEGLSVLPASTSAIEALIRFKEHRKLSSDYVLVLTGRKFR